MQFVTKNWFCINSTTGMKMNTPSMIITMQSMWIKHLKYLVIILLI